jgi:hypothetical protein
MQVSWLVYRVSGSVLRTWIAYIDAITFLLTNKENLVFGFATAHNVPCYGNRRQVQGRYATRNRMW